MQLKMQSVMQFMVKTGALIITLLYSTVPLNKGHHARNGQYIGSKRISLLLH